MKTDLDQLMTERKFDALLVTGASTNNPPMYYLVNGVHVGERTVLVKPRGQAPVLLVNAMERDEAARSGLRVIDLARFREPELLREAKGDALQARAKLLGRILSDLGVSGTVAAYGQEDQGAAFALLSAVEEHNPGLRVVGEFSDDVFSLARATKDAGEVKRIRAVAKATVAVVGGVQEFLTAHRAHNGYLIKKDGARLTIGEVKRHMRGLFLAHNVVDAADATIFAIGRDAGVPHSRGNPRDPIALGKTIVFDIFPSEPGGGYVYDFTRTWCVGHAPDHVLEAYEHVRAAYKIGFKHLEPGGPCRAPQTAVCDYFEAHGHPTQRSHPGTTDGYVHSLGHGIGLQVHEAPGLHDRAGNTALLAPGVVVSVEPGLYYPDHPRGGYGVRLEDSVWLNPQTRRFEVLAKYPYDLVLPVKAARR